MKKFKVTLTFTAGAFLNSFNLSKILIYQIKIFKGLKLLNCNVQEIDEDDKNAG